MSKAQQPSDTRHFYEAVERKGFYYFRLPLLNRTVRLQEPLLLILVGALVGVFTGFVTVGYRLAVHHGNQVLIEGVARNNEAEHLILTNLFRLLLPAVGGLIVGALLHFLHKPSRLTGVPAVLRAMQTGNVHLPNSMALASASSVVILATGGSAGPEGPIAEIGSVMGARTGRRLKLPPKAIRTLIASGVAAGIASVFNAPLGGVLFAIEVIMQEYALATFAPIVMASVVSSLITLGFLGEIPAIAATSAITQVSSRFHELPLFVLLGLATGGCSILFIKSADAVRAQFLKLKTPLWLTPAIGGLMVGVIGLFLPEVMGEGYGFLNKALDPARNPFSFLDDLPGGLWLPLLFLVLAGAKMLVTSVTLGSGSPGGVFAPGVFVGVALGLCVGGMAELIWPDIDPVLYGLMGMAGMISGMFNAPLTAIVIVLGLATRNYQVLLPLMTTVALSVFIMHRWQNVSVYTWTLKKMGLPWGQQDLRDPLLGVTVGEICQRKFLTFDASKTVSDALDAMRDSDYTHFVVRAPNGRCAGHLSLSDLRVAIQDFEVSHLLTLSDLLDPTEPRLLESTPLRDAARILSRMGKNGAAVYRSETDDWPVGIATRASVLEAYRGGQ